MQFFKANGTTAVMTIDTTNSKILPLTIDIPTNLANSATGVIYKNAVRFIHNYAPSGVTESNVFVGENAGNFTATRTTGAEGSRNNGFGANALTALTTGHSNTAFGFNAASGMTTGSFNNCIGGYAGGSIQGGKQNNMQGWFAGGAVTSGEANTVIGESALRFNQTGWGNVAIGWRCLFGASGQSNQHNTAVGYAAGNAMTTGSYNVLLGWTAGDAITSGSYNIVIGIGDAQSATASNQLNIGNAIWGTGLTGTGTTDAGLIGIGTNAPATKLHVLATTEQLRLGYDASNYLSFTVGSTGSTTFALTGTTPIFTFSQAVKGGGGFQSSDGTAGATGTQVIVTAVTQDAGTKDITVTTKTITFKNGLITSIA
jgi:hypothetical protein